MKQKSISIVLVLLLGYHLLQAQQQLLQVQHTAPDTTFISYAALAERKIPKKINYHQTLTLKLFLSGSAFDGKFKRKDNGKSEVLLTIADALVQIKKIDNLTIGIPKVVYLVGWQYNGHDSKYPAWFEGNELLKRPQDKNCLQSIKWLMNEASKYNTIESLHINMFDAYEDSPLWNEYVKNDIIAKNIDGTLRSGEWGYPVSYAQEWKTGFAQKRIDSLCALLPLADAGTVHIDAFHTWPPIPVKNENGEIHIDLSKGPISPYLKFSVADETAAQRNIFKYWASKGVDITSEGVQFLRESAFEGYQAMAWWYEGLANYLKWPASYYCGGQDNSEWGKLFGTSMHGEDIIVKDPEDLTGFKKQFSLSTVVWFYLNQLKRNYLLTDKDYKAVQYTDDVRTFLSKDTFRLTQGDAVLVENDDMLVPAGWIKGKCFIAYSKNGYQNREWLLPAMYRKIKKVTLYSISKNGKTKLQERRIKEGKLILSLAKDEMLLIEKK